MSRIDIFDALGGIRNMVAAADMAVASIGDRRGVNAIQSVLGCVEASIDEVSDMIEAALGSAAPDDEVQQVCDLIATYSAARRAFDDIPDDEGLQTAGLAAIDDALVAICSFHPASAPAVRLRRDFLSSTLVDATFNDEALTARVFTALLPEPAE